MTGIGGKVEKRFNYYNAEDYALHSMWLFSWEDNNRMRPDINYLYTEGDGNVDTYQTELGDRFYTVIPYDARTLLLPTDTFEIFSYATEARASAIGVRSSMEAFSEFNLSGSLLNYDDQHYSHSRQFRSNIIDEWQYWNKVISDADLPRIK